MFNRVKSLLALTVLATFGFASVATADEIVRTGEGRNFYNNISIPAGAETLYLSGSGASPMEDGSWGDMEQQTVDTFSKFKETLESQGWSMEDISASLPLSSGRSCRRYRRGEIGAGYQKRHDE